MILLIPHPPPTTKNPIQTNTVPVPVAVTVTMMVVGSIECDPWVFQQEHPKKMRTIATYLHSCHDLDADCHPRNGHDTVTLKIMIMRTMMYVTYRLSFNGGRWYMMILAIIRMVGHNTEMKMMIQRMVPVVVPVAVPLLQWKTRLNGDPVVYEIQKHLVIMMTMNVTFDGGRSIIRMAGHTDFKMIQMIVIQHQESPQ
jgi:hypothetical protein